MRSLVAATLLATSLAGMTSEPAHGDRLIARDVIESTHVRGHGGWLVWSGQRVGEGRFRLMARRGGRTFALRGVPRRRNSPFDVDIGPGPDGRPVAVYTRDGRLRMRRLGRDTRERPLRIAVSRGADVVWPTIWRKRIAYVVRRRGRPDEIRSGPIGGTHLRVRVYPGSDAERIGPPRAQHLDMRGHRIVFSWRREARGAVDIYLATGRQGLRRLGGGFGDDGGPGFDKTGPPILQNGLVRWTVYEERTGPPSNCSCLYTYDLRSRTVGRRPVTTVRGVIAGVATNERRLFAWSIDTPRVLIRQLSAASWPENAHPLPLTLPLAVADL